KKCACAEIEAKIKGAERVQQNAAPQWDESIHDSARAAASVTRLEQSHRFGNVGLIDSRIGVNEKQIFTLSCARAGVSGSRYLPSLDRHDSGASLLGDFRRRIR